MVPRVEIKSVPDSYMSVPITDTARQLAQQVTLTTVKDSGYLVRATQRAQGASLRFYEGALSHTATETGRRILTQAGSDLLEHLEDDLDAAIAGQMPARLTQDTSFLYPPKTLPEAVRTALALHAEQNAPTNHHVNTTIAGILEKPNPSSAIISAWDTVPPDETSVLHALCSLAWHVKGAYAAQKDYADKALPEVWQEAINLLGSIPAWNQKKLDALEYNHKYFDAIWKWLATKATKGLLIAQSILQTDGTNLVFCAVLPDP